MKTTDSGDLGTDCHACSRASLPGLIANPNTLWLSEVQQGLEFLSASFSYLYQQSFKMHENILIW